MIIDVKDMTQEEKEELLGELASKMDLKVKPKKHPCQKNLFLHAFGALLLLFAIIVSVYTLIDLVWWNI